MKNNQLMMIATVLLLVTTTLTSDIHEFLAGEYVFIYCSLLSDWT